MSRTLPTSGHSGSPAAVRGTRVTEPGSRPRRLSGSTSPPSASSRSRNSRHSRAFSRPVGAPPPHQLAHRPRQLHPAQARTVPHDLADQRHLPRAEGAPREPRCRRGHRRGAPFPTTPYQNAARMSRGAPEAKTGMCRRRDQDGQKPKRPEAVPDQNAPVRGRPRAQPLMNEPDSTLRKRAAPIGKRRTHQVGNGAGIHSNDTTR